MSSSAVRRAAADNERAKALSRRAAGSRLCLPTADESEEGKETRTEERRAADVGSCTFRRASKTRKRRSVLCVGSVDYCLYDESDAGVVMQFVRQSKFRHVYCKPMKHEFCLQDVRITKVSWDSLFCDVNPKFIAVITEGSGGPFVVIPIGKVGRLEKDYPIVDAHKAPCLEVAWCPFNDNVIASCSEDATAKVWHIPDRGLVRNLTEPIVTLCGHQKRVASIVWHPSANSILLTAGADLKILIWNVGTGEALIEIAGHPDQIWSVAFNYDGSKIVTACKDHNIRVIDPRSGQIVQQGLGHEGVKPQRAIFLKDGRIFTTGFTKRSERMYALRDEGAIEEPIIQEELDTSMGVLYPLYDPDSGLVYLCAKGDCNIRYYEVNNDPPFVHYIETYSNPEPQRGIAFMPKRGLSVTENEINRVMKVTNKGLVDALQFFVPRKSDIFQDDLYPNTRGTTPAISAEEWMSGKNADPILVAVHQPPAAAAGSGEATKSKVKKANILAEMPSSTPATGVVQSASAAASATLNAPTPAEERRRDRPKATAGIEPIGAAAPASAEPHVSYQQQKTQSRQDKFSSARHNFEDGGHREEYASPAANTVQMRIGSAANSGGQQPLDRLSTSAETTARLQAVEQMGLDELINDVQKMKVIVRQHERRIRSLEERLAERHLMDVDGMLTQ